MVLSIIAAVLAATAPASCEAARADYESLSLEAALEKAEAELAKSAERRPECLEVKALSLMVLGRSDEARAAFRDLFSREIDHVVGDRSLAPSQRELIEDVRESVRPLRATVRAQWLVRDLLRLEVLLGGGLRGADHLRYELELKPAGTKQAGVISLVGRVATATVAIPAEATVGTIALSGRVIDQQSRVLHTFENESILPARPPPPERVDGDGAGVPWFVWVGIGAGVIGASVAIAVLAQPSGPDCGSTAGCFEIGNK